MIVNHRFFSLFYKIRKLDNKVVDRITALDCAFMDKLMIMATYAGTGGFIWFVALVLPFLLSDMYRRAGVILMLALGINYLVGEIIIKNSVGRERPSTLLPEDEMKITKPKGHSFPSGHSASSFCAATVMVICCPPAVWIPSLAVACVIAFSRIYLRVHYLSDVIGGVALGVIDGVVSTALIERLIFTRLAF